MQQTEANNFVETEPLTWKFWKKRRYIVVMMAFFGFFNVYSLRVNLSVGIVAMTENRTVLYENGTVGYVSLIQRKIKCSLTNLFNCFRTIHRNKIFRGIQRSAA